MNSSSLCWTSYCSSTTGFQWFGEADVSHFYCLLRIFCCFRSNIQPDKNDLSELFSNGAWNSLKIFSISGSVHTKLGPNISICLMDIPTKSTQRCPANFNRGVVNLANERVGNHGHLIFV